MKGLSQNFHSLLPRVYQEILKTRIAQCNYLFNGNKGFQNRALRRISEREAGKQLH